MLCRQNIRKSNPGHRVFSENVSEIDAAMASVRTATQAGHHHRISYQIALPDMP